MDSSWKEELCPICHKAPDSTRTTRTRYGRHIVCPRCGLLDVTYEAHFVLDERQDRHLLAGLTRLHSDVEKTRYDITKDNIDILFTQIPSEFDVPGKVRWLLLNIARRSKFPGDEVLLDPHLDGPLGCVENIDEFAYVSLYTESEGWCSLRVTNTGYRFILTPRGWEETRHAPRRESRQAFVAMWFHDNALSAYKDGIQPAIEECGYDAFVVNRAEFIGDVVDEIMAQVRQSRFVVADVTGQRNGVYFEAGFAVGLGIPVIWSTHKDELDKKKIHFDTEHFNHIVWTSPAELRSKLANRIKAIIGAGPSQP